MVAKHLASSLFTHVVSFSSNAAKVKGRVLLGSLCEDSQFASSTSTWDLCDCFNRAPGEKRFSEIRVARDLKCVVRVIIMELVCFG